MSGKATEKISIEETVYNFMASLRELSDYVTNADEKVKRRSSSAEKGKVSAKKKVMIAEPESDVKKKKKSAK